MNKLLTAVALLSSLTLSGAAFSSSARVVENRVDSQLARKLDLKPDAVLHLQEEKIEGSDKTWVTGKAFEGGVVAKTFRASFDTSTGRDVKIVSQTAGPLSKQAWEKVDTSLLRQLDLPGHVTYHTDDQVVAGTGKTIMTGTAFVDGVAAKTFTANYDTRTGEHLQVVSQSGDQMSKDVWNRVESALNAKLGLGPDAVLHADTQAVAGTGKTIIKGTEFVNGVIVKKFSATYDTQTGADLEVVSEAGWGAGAAR